MKNIIKAIPFQVILFLFIFGCLALFINNRNTVAFGFQPQGIQALVENGKFYIDGPTFPNAKDFLTYTWDTFPYKDHVYLAKQPAEFILGAIPYFFLHKLGINYRNNGDLVQGIIALYASSLMTALMAVFIFNICLKITAKTFPSFLLSCSFVFGTLILPYSGILHHDMCATFFLLLAFYLLFRRYHINDKSSKYTVALAGFCTGFSFFNSYNTPSIILILFLYVVLKKNLKDIILFSVFLTMGIMITLLYNKIVFSDFFNFPIIIYSKYYNFLHELEFKNYLPTIPGRIFAYVFSPITGTLFYSPIYLISYLGILFLPRKYLVEKIILSLAFPIQFITPISQGPNAYGWCQYGSRYLLESIPFTMVGLSSFFTNKASYIPGILRKYKYLYHVIFAIGIISFIVCALGTFGTIYCGYYDNAFLTYLAKVIAGDFPKYHFVPCGLILIACSILFFKIKYPGRTKAIVSSIRNHYINSGISKFYIHLILMIAFIVRVLTISKQNEGILSNEAVIGYNAYCISETGKDENGRILPLFFLEQNSFKFPVFIYISAFFIRLFGPAIFSIRFASCVLGVLSIFFLYKLIRLHFSEKLALIISFFLCFSKLHVEYSTLALEPITLFLFFILSLYMLSLGIIKQQNKYIIYSSLPIALSFYAGGLQISFVFLLYLIFVFLNRKNISKQALITCMIFLLILLIPFTTFPDKKLLFNKSANNLTTAISNIKTGNESDIYDISKVIETMKDYDAFIIPFDFNMESFLFLQKIKPNDWFENKSLPQFLTSYASVCSDLNKKIARITKPDLYKNEETIGHIYKSKTTEVLYEIKNVSKVKLKNIENYIPSEIGGLKGEYFNKSKLRDLRETIVDSSINFEWVWDPPVNSVTNDFYSIRWSGWINTETEGEYKFASKANGKVRLIIDNKYVINTWETLFLNDSAEGTIKLSKGWHQLQFEFSEEGGYGYLSLRWQKPGGQYDLIPSSALASDNICIE